MADDLMNVLVARIRKEMPDVADESISPMGAVGRMLSPGALAVQSPFGGIKYDPQALAGSSPAEVEDTLVHELTHARQARRMSLLEQLGTIGTGIKRTLGLDLPYGQRPEELEALQAEADRAVSQGRPAPANPSFSQPGQWNTRGDIMLPRPRKK